MDVTVTYMCILPDECGVLMCHQKKLSLSPAETYCELATCKHLCTDRTASVLCRVCDLHHLGPLEVLDETFVYRSVFGSAGFLL